MKFAGVIAGLGNPGQKYVDTRHNCGFMFIKKLLQMGQSEILNGKKFNALCWKFSMSDLPGEWLLTEPQTFMNDSGRAIQPLLAWYKLEPRDLIVVQDELDLPLGELRFKFGGGLAGHNGLSSIARHLGTQDFYRLRIGIGRPLHKTEVIDWVLTRPDAQDLARLYDTIEDGIEVLRTFAQDGLEAAAAYARKIKNE